MNFLNKLADFFRLIRAANCVIAAGGVLVGAYLTGQLWLTRETVATAIAVFLVCAGGNCLNDLRDVEIDKVSHPERVLVRGRISKQFAGVVAGLMFALGLALAATVNLGVILFGLAGIILTITYDLWWKRMPLVGNLAVALSASLTFLIGGSAVGPTAVLQLPGPVVPATFAFLFHTVREIVKDAEDLEGDRGAGIVSLPDRLGLRRSLQVATGLTIGLILLTVTPYFLNWFGLVYLVVGVGLAELPALVFLIRLIGNPEQRLLHWTSGILKVGMILGLSALILG